MRFITGRKTLCSIATALMLTIGPIIPAHAQRVLFDFGNTQSFRGLSVPNPDANGNTWNSFRTGLFYQNLVDVDNTATTIDFGFSSPVATDSYNGPAGVTSATTLLTDVTFADVDPIALGDIGGGCDFNTGTGNCEGVFDFVASDPGVPVRFEIQALNPTSTYTLSFFGSHKYSTDNATVYSIYTNNTYTTLVQSVTLNHQDTVDPSLHNRDTLATITGISPQEGNILYIQFHGDQGNQGYLNALLLEGVSNGLAGDFDGDNDVDGRDFLVWQRNTSVGNLSDWQNNYPTPGPVSAVTAIPEPTSLCLIFVASLVVARIRKPSHPIN